MTNVEGNPNDEFAVNGFEIVFNVLATGECDQLAAELSSLRPRESGHNNRGGLRNLLQRLPQVAGIATSEVLKAILEKRLRAQVFPVRALFFDKTPGANWFVPWHQDLIIAVAEKVETNGFETWTMKDGVVHVQPPREIQESIATIRVHLDECAAENGALKVISGSHLHGKLSASEIDRRVREQSAVVCEVSKGGAVLMRPLLIHSSASARVPSHRRVLDIQYATRELPNGLRWIC
jgi:ectoine hydroxylase-related dioxygenase (phytanoyl-CoA dioxygenase family)